jgi:beta-lactamase class A
MVKRPHNDSNARTLIQQISRTAYQHFKWYQTQPAAKPQPVAQSSPSPSPVVIPSSGN